MRIQLVCFLITLLLTHSLQAESSKDTDKALNDLFKQFDHAIGAKNKVDLFKEIYTPKYLEELGGAKALETKLKGSKSLGKDLSITWKEGAMDKNIYLVRLIKKGVKSDKEFIVIKQDNKFRIQGMMNDAD